MICTSGIAHTVLCICFQSHHLFSYPHITFKNEEYCSFGVCLYLFFLIILLFCEFHSFTYSIFHNDAQSILLNGGNFFLKSLMTE